MRALLLILPTVLMLAGGAVPTADGTPSPVPAAAGHRAGNVSPPPASEVRYRLPLTGRAHVIRGFGPPLTRYGAGHLGVDLRAGAGLVLAAGPGRVTFAGSVAGRGVVVVIHPDGVSTEYEPVRPLVRQGQAVTAGESIGTVDGVHRGCPGRCLHWGARRGGDYLDPMSLLRALGPVRLLPLRGG